MLHWCFFKPVPKKEREGDENDLFFPHQMEGVYVCQLIARSKEAGERQKKASEPNPFEATTAKPVEEAKEKSVAESDNPFDNSSFFGASSSPATQQSPKPEPSTSPKQPGLTSAQKSSLSKGLVALEGAKFDEACLTFKILCGQIREAVPDKVPVIVQYYMACLAMKSLTSSLGSSQLKDLPHEKQVQLAAIATKVTQLKLHPAHKKAMLAIAAVFSDYAYAQFARETSADSAPVSMTVNCSCSCWKCHEACDPALPRCVSCGEPITLTADTMDVVTSENIASLRRCSECSCFFSQVDASESHCPVCDGALQ